MILAETEVSKTTARKAVEEAGRALDRRAVPRAKGLMTEAAGALKKSADSLDQLAVDLGSEAAAARQAAHEKVDLEKALGPKQADRSEALQRMDALEEKLGQVAANMAQGRGLGEALGMDLPGAGLGGRGGGENLPWTLPYRRSMSRFNRKVYEEFVKDMRKRLNPDNYYGEPEAADGLDSVARVGGEQGAAVIFVEALPEKKTAVNKNRKVSPPDFPYLAFGAAPMMEKSVVIDGDLSDWGQLRHGLKMRYNTRSETVKIVNGPTVYVRWSPEGLYFGYTVKDTNGIQPCKDHSWSGDCIEVMIDTANSRLPRAYKNMYSQKFSFTPFGCRGSQAVKVWEMGRGLRGLRMAGDTVQLLYTDARAEYGEKNLKRKAELAVGWPVMKLGGN